MNIVFLPTTAFLSQFSNKPQRAPLYWRRRRILHYYEYLPIVGTILLLFFIIIIIYTDIESVNIRYYNEQVE